MYVCVCARVCLFCMCMKIYVCIRAFDICQHIHVHVHACAYLGIRANDCVCALHLVWRRGCMCACACACADRARIAISFSLPALINCQRYNPVICPDRLPGYLPTDSPTTSPPWWRPLQCRLRREIGQRTRWASLALSGLADVAAARWTVPVRAR